MSRAQPWSISFSSLHVLLFFLWNYNMIKVGCNFPEENASENAEHLANYPNSVLHDIHIKNMRWYLHQKNGSCSWWLTALCLLLVFQHPLQTPFLQFRGQWIKGQVGGDIFSFLGLKEGVKWSGLDVLVLELGEEHGLNVNESLSARKDYLNCRGVVVPEEVVILSG